MYQTFLVAFGSNAEGPKTVRMDILSHSIAEMSTDGCMVDAVSGFYRTPCFPAGAGPDFINGAAMIRSGMTPDSFLNHLHQIEAAAGRVRTKRWGQRVLDLDLIAAGGRVLPDLATFTQWRDLPLERQMQEAPAQLILPHPRMHERAFVLVPLMDIAPDWQHPVSGLTVREMCDALSDSDREEVRRIAEIPGK